MPTFNYRPGSAEWETPRMPANNWWRKTSNSFSSNFVGQYVTAKFREWVYQPLFLSFVPGVKTYKVDEKAAAGTLGKYMRVRWRGQDWEKEFVPTIALGGQAYEKKLITDMKSRLKKLEQLGATIDARSRNAQGQTTKRTFKQIAGDFTDDYLTTNKKLLREREELKAFLRTYATNKKTIRQIRRYEKLARKKGKPFGEVSFAEIGKLSPKLPENPNTKITSDSSASAKMAQALLKEYHKQDLNEKDQKRLQHYRSGELNSIRFKGRHYAFSMGEGTTPQLFQEVISDHSVRRLAADIYNWRTYKDTGGRAMPHPDLWKFHFNLGINRYIKGESDKDWWDRTYANTSKMLGDPAGRTLMRKFYDEGVLKRFNVLGINGVTGECLAKAMAEYSGNLTRVERLPGFKSKTHYSLEQLNTRQITALHNHLIGSGLIGAKFKKPGPISPNRMQELLGQLDTLRRQFPDGNNWKINMIEDSLKDQQDYLEFANVASIDASEQIKKIKPWTSLLINEDGALGLTTTEVTEEGHIMPHLPFGTKPFYTVPHWDWPTITPEGLTTMEYLRAYRPFVEKIVRLGKTLDTSAGELFYQHRQILKGMIQQYTHDGSIDDGSDIAMKLAMILGLKPEEATSMHLVIHEHQERWDGSKLDHLRNQMRDMGYTLDETMRSFYFGSGSETENYPQKRYKGYADRTKFIRKTIMNQSFANIINDYNQTLQAAHNQVKLAQSETDPDKVAKYMVNAEKIREDAAKIRKKFTEYAQLTLKDDLAIAVEKSEEPNKRIEKVVEWLLGHSEIMTTYFMKHSVAHAAGPAGGVSYNKYAAQMSKQSAA